MLGTRNWAPSTNGFTIECSRFPCLVRVPVALWGRTTTAELCGRHCKPTVQTASGLALAFHGCNLVPAQGEPKAIPWTHVTPIRCAVDAWGHQDVRPGDVISWPTNLGWMMGPWLIYAALLNGAAVGIYEARARCSVTCPTRVLIWLSLCVPVRWAHLQDWQTIQVLKNLVCTCHAVTCRVTPWTEDSASLSRVLVSPCWALFPGEEARPAWCCPCGIARLDLRQNLQHLCRCAAPVWPHQSALSSAGVVLD